MFRYPQDNPEPGVKVFIQGKEVSVPANTSVAAAMLAYENGPTRYTPVSQSARAPFCMMGVCFECLMIIDGKSNQQACMHPVREGMTIEKQIGAGSSVV